MAENHHTDIIQQEPGRLHGWANRPNEPKGLKGPFSPDVIARFFAKLENFDDPNACHIFTGYKPNGYGRFSLKPGRNVRAHVLAYAIHYGEVPPGKMVLHSCPDGDDPACCNPLHLCLGNEELNAKHLAERGPSPKPILRGGTRRRSLITDEQAEDIRDLYATGGWAQWELSVMFGVDQTAISKIILGKTHKAA